MLLVLAILLVSAGLRLYQLGTPGEGTPGYMFDEVYYAKDAKAIIDGRVGPRKGVLRWWPGDENSWGHPEAGKLAIALGIIVLGDRPLGWRLPSVVAGLVILACVYPIASRLGLPRRWALVALLFAACDLLGIAQSRIAMLDIFVAAWTTLCSARRAALRAGRGAAALAASRPGSPADSRSRRSGPGRSLCSPRRRSWSWSARCRRSGRADAATSPDRRPRRSWWTVSALGVLCLVALPAAIYVVSYAQYFASGHSLADFRELHSQMWHWNLNLHAHHSYASQPPTWLIDYRPVWYLFVDQGETYRGLVAMGNPFLWWASAAALVAAPLLAMRRGRAAALAPAVLVAILFVPWFATTRTSFLYFMLPLAPLIAVLFVAARPRRTASSGAATSAAALAPAVLVAILYLPWFATTRTSFLCYMTPVAPLMAVLLAAVLWVLEGGRSDAPKRVWPRPALVTAAGAATVTALFWWQIARRAAFVFWELPGRAGPGIATAVDRDRRWACATVARAEPPRRADGGRARGRRGRGAIAGRWRAPCGRRVLAAARDLAGRPPSSPGRSRRRGRSPRPPGPCCRRDRRARATPAARRGA